jgi:hypothetical protein
VLSEGVEGDLIETGVWRGGASIFMRAVLAAYGIEDRKIFVADSFEGLPAPDAEKYPADQNERFHTYTYLAVSKEDVENNFRKYGLLDNQVVFLKGWFKDTLPQAPIEACHPPSGRRYVWFNHGVTGEFISEIIKWGFLYYR